MDDLGFVQTFINLDHRIFEAINKSLGNPVFDLIFPFLTDLNHRPILIPFILALFAFWIFKLRMKAVIWIVALVVSVGLSDFVSYRVIKSTAGRARPEQAGIPVVLRTTHHSGSSFPSNHAANAFAGAAILSAAFPPAAPYFVGVAAAIAFSRVYVGVHFPSDVVAGGLLGWLIAFIVRVLLASQIAKADREVALRRERAIASDDRARRARWMKK